MEDIQGVPKKLRESGAHKTAFLEIFFFDVQGVGTYLFVDFLIIEDPHS